MSVQVYASGTLIYDSRIPEEKQRPILSAHIREGINKGGTASLVLPPLHPKRDCFPAYAVPVEIYRNGALRWRGRPLPSTCDIYGRMTVPCEGELCFLQDVTHRPYAYVGTPDEVFRQVLSVYNTSVEPWKRFSVGVVSVTSEEAVILSSTDPEKIFATVAKLRQMCGGYILFDTALDGSRQINWFKELPHVCRQKIRLGYNLTNYSNQINTTAFATRIIPFGDRDDSGIRLTIDNGGKDYVEDADAVALYGIVEKPVIYNGITDPAELEALARKDLQTATALPETVRLNAVDMSHIDMTLDSFAVGQRVEAESALHNLSGWYDLVELEEDLINPAVGSVTVTRDAATYTKGTGTLTGTVQQQTSKFSKALTHEEIFQRWTNGGKIQGIHVQDSKWYINAEIAQIINLKAESITAGKLSSIDGKSYFDLTAGKIVTNNITATGGTIGGCSIVDGKLQVPSANITGTITAGKIVVKNTAGSTLLSAGDNAVTIAGWQVAANGLWKATADGQIRLIPGGNLSQNYTVNGHAASNWVMLCGPDNSTVANFGVSKAGKLYAKDANLSGVINATAGKIGNWTVDKNGYLEGSGGANTIRLYPKGLQYGGYTFYIVFYASGGATPIGGLTASGWKSI